jgi:hypothetical protein
MGVKTREWNKSIDLILVLRKIRGFNSLIVIGNRGYSDPSLRSGWRN